jgi:hypothetical protein
VILERLLLETELKVAILDPNSDFVRLDRVRPRDEVNRTRSSVLSPEGYENLLARYGRLASKLRILRPAPYAEDPSKLLRIRFSDLERHEQGLVLGLDPLRDREEFNAYWRAIEGFARDRRPGGSSLACDDTTRAALRYCGVGLCDRHTQDNHRNRAMRRANVGTFLGAVCGAALMLPVWRASVRSRSR